MSVDNFTKKNSDSFSLFELIIVIFIIGIVYSLVTINFPITEIKHKITLQNLKSYLISIKKDNIPLKLLCYDECQKCLIYDDNNINKSINLNLRLDEDLRVLRRDIFGEIRDIEFGKIDIDNREENICLEFNIFNNLSSSHLIIVDNDKYFAYPAYFRDVKSFKIESEAINYLYFDNDSFPTSEDDYFK